MAGKMPSIEELVDAQEYDPEVAQALLEDIATAGTADKIRSGELVLPGKQDASHWHRRITGRADETSLQQAQRERIEALEATVNELNQRSALPDPHYIEELEKRLKAVEKGQR